MTPQPPPDLPPGRERRLPDPRGGEDETGRAESETGAAEVSGDLSGVGREAEHRFADDGLPPPTVPNHTVFQCIGAGSYGKVWLARDVMGQWRAVKAVYERKFGRDKRGYEREYEGIEAYGAVSLSHESLLPILHVGRDAKAGCFFYVMEAADQEDGARPRSEIDYRPKTLREVMRRQPQLAAKECVMIASELAEALDRLHKAGLIHRDVKPANIIFVHGRAKLADVGLVTGLDATLTEVGTFGYIGPKFFGQPKGDIYSLGKVLYEMATSLDRQKWPQLPPAREMNRENYDRLLDLSYVFNRACTPLSDDRYSDAAGMLKDLLLLKAGESLREQQRWQRRRDWVKKYRWQAAAALGIGVAALAFWVQRQHAVETARQREVLLRNAQLIRARDRTDGSGGPCFSPDGRLLAWGTVDGMVMVADLDEVKRRLGSLGQETR